MPKVPEMSTDFARWYADSFMDEGAKRDLRWKGIVDVTSKAGYQTAEVLTRLAFRPPVPAEGRKTEDLKATYEGVISTISGGDSAFDPSKSARELQILAAAALARLVGTLPDAALIVTTASCGGHRNPELPMDLIGLAEKALVELSRRKHARTDLDKLKIAPSKVDFAPATDALASMEPAEWKAQIELLRDATTSAIGQVVAGQNRVIELLHKQISLDEEELQMLWWLLGGYSRELEKPFPEIEAPVKPVVLAYELAGMTAVSPGPSSIRAMLSRAGIGTEQAKIADVVNNVDLDWAKSISNSKLVSPATTPIHFALEQRAELGSNDTWQAVWSGLTGLSGDIVLSAVKLAELFYRERLFITVSA